MLMHRPYLPLFKCFYIFLFFCVGCQHKENIGFLEKFEVREDRVHTEIFRAEDFPTSVDYVDLKSSLLLAGSREGLSFYVEYYELQSPQDTELDIILEDGWNQKGRTSFLERAVTVDEEKAVEIQFFRKEYPFALFGSFVLSHTDKSQLKTYMPEIFDN